MELYVLALRCPRGGCRPLSRRGLRLGACRTPAKINHSKDIHADNAPAKVFFREVIRRGAGCAPAGLQAGETAYAGQKNRLKTALGGCFEAVSGGFNGSRKAG